MLTMIPLDKLLQSFGKKPKTPIRKLQRSPKIIGYERECCEVDDDPLLSYEDINGIDCDDHQGKFTNNNNNNKGLGNNKDNSVRVKVLLTKEEAAKLLAKCKGEGCLDFKDVVMQLGKLPAQRIDVSVTRFDAPSKDLELATILEEEEEGKEEE